jgi:alkanesulfonate monooxygenase SsuD/methylene tetrahydromethanopterin reductase-like flavin-dependent oxidoreductase (luciferase family)
MKVGAFFNYQNHLDWDRFNARSTEPPKVPDTEIYDEDLHLAGLLEPLGYDSYWAIDHYASPYGMTGGVLQHLTYFAGRTTRLELGTMVLVLPWYDPIRAVHELSVLDNLLQGRKLTLGIGRGAAVREFDAFRVPMGDARGRYNECLDIIRLALANEWFSYDGEHFKIPETTVRPRFRNGQRILDDIRSGWASAESLPLAANAGLGMLLTNQKSWDEYRQEVARFNGIRRSHGWQPTQPTVAIRVACFDTEAEAWDLMSRYVIEGERSALAHYQLGDVERMLKTKGYEQYAARGRREFTDEQLVENAALSQGWGTPDQVYEKLIRIQRMTGASEFVLSFRFGTMPAEKAEQSMRLFASDVLPRLHAYDATLDVSLAGDEDTVAAP